MKAGLDSLKWSVNACDEAQFEERHGCVGEVVSPRARQYPHRVGNAPARRLHDRALRVLDPLRRQQQAEHGAAARRSACNPTSTSTTGCPCTRWAPSRRSARKNSATGQRRATRGASARCEIRCRAGLHLPKATSRPKASCPPAVSTRRQIGPWATSPRCPLPSAWNSPPFVALREAHLRKDVRGTVCESCLAYS